MQKLDSNKVVNIEEAMGKLEDLKKALKDMISLSTIKKRVVRELGFEEVRFFEGNEEFHTYLEDIC